MHKTFNFSNNILNWFHIYHRKKLPWTKNKNIYKIWISEIMLQQTQVKVVIPYFKKFIQKFPNLKNLSKASLNEILYIWSGLGFYKRAKNIYKTVQIIKNKYNNKFPKEFNNLINLPGIGKSTAGAILSLTHNYCFPILDGNVKRILKRFYNYTLKNYKLEKKLWKKINCLIPIHNCAKFNQALMDLGSLICKIKNPICIECPLKTKCLFNKQNNILKINDLNHKKIKKIKKCWFILLKYKNFFYLEQQKQKIWKNLYYFPFFFKKKKAYKWIQKNTLKIKKIKKKKNFLHHFNYYSLLIHPILVLINIKKQIKKKKNIWFNISKPPIIGIPAPVKKIFLKFIKKDTKED
ncbi:A/G-specific adenine glycosylase [Buchnera aphidicola]|uniref:A/G-specific adenine glycosylase n=1 Tax=Buchnera aphidicola TaxID=9 RepID=UPI002238BAF3|nr:A/G-specific adenine glycosylase [Buchnera aphidicola]MCW5197457.1 A/G-specific adenine glycosylase [Buchnera aphidicola (Chaitophorus viminalis)]